MNNLNLLIICILFTLIQSYLSAQSEPILYFCERYDDYEGEVGIGDRFTKGSATILVRSDNPLNLIRLIIRYDKYNARKNQFEYYKKSFFDTEQDKNFLTFVMNKENGMEFEHQGFYRVYLLDEDEQMITSALIEIID